MAHSELFYDGLTEEQATILQAVLSSKTMDQAAGALGMSRRSLYRALEQPELSAALRQARRQMVEQAVTQLQAEAAEAVATLAAIHKNPRASFPARVRACELIIDLAFRGAELVDIQAELAELREYYEQTK